MGLKNLVETATKFHRPLSRPFARPAGQRKLVGVAEGQMPCRRFCHRSNQARPPPGRFGSDLRIADCLQLQAPVWIKLRARTNVVLRILRSDWLSIARSIDFLICMTKLLSLVLKKRCILQFAPQLRLL